MIFMLLPLISAASSQLYVATYGDEQNTGVFQHTTGFIDTAIKGIFSALSAHAGALTMAAATIAFNGLQRDRGR
jgi:hypothetical protein